LVQKIFHYSGMKVKRDNDKGHSYILSWVQLIIRLIAISFTHLLGERQYTSLCRFSNSNIVFGG